MPHRIFQEMSYKTGQGIIKNHEDKNMTNMVRVIFFRNLIICTNLHINVYNTDHKEKCGFSHHGFLQ